MSVEVNAQGEAKGTRSGEDGGGGRVSPRDR